jgi:hypothetical protein
LQQNRKNAYACFSGTVYSQASQSDMISVKYFTSAAYAICLLGHLNYSVLAYGVRLPKLEGQNEGSGNYPSKWEDKRG